jgi:hypothetical protein
MSESQMAITPLAIPCHTFEDAVRIAKTSSELSGQSRNEVFQSLDMLQIWKDSLKATFGELTGINHRSQPDDPPDLELIFGSRIVGMEHTKLLPSHVGEAEAWLRKSGQGGGLPSISSPPASKEELRDIVVGIKPAWSNVVDDWKAIFDLLAITLRKKMGGMPGGGIIGVVCDLFVLDQSDHLLVQIAQDIVNRTEFSDFEKYILIVLNRSTHSTFYSALIRRGRDTSEQRGNTPPLSPAHEKLLAEIQSIEAQADDESS